MIIIEGADGSGKTTLAALILAAFPKFKMIHSPGPLNMSNVNERLFWNKEITKLDYVISDRITVVSERIYGPIIRKKSLINLQHFAEFITHFRNVNKKNIIVFCDRQFTAIKKDHGAIHMTHSQKLKLEDEVEDQIEPIRKAYRELFRNLFSAHQSLNSFTVRTEEDVIELFNFIRSNYEY